MHVDNDREENKIESQTKMIMSLDSTLRLLQVLIKLVSSLDQAWIELSPSFAPWDELFLP